jgi:hypothetical protein
VAILAGMAAYVGSLMGLIHGGVSLVAFPQAMLVGRAVCIVVSAVLLLWVAREKPATA